MTLRYCLLALFLSVLSATAAAAGQPRVGLVLGGGGARGAAHIGVLEVLAEQRIPIACIAGTSMGGLVAGAWAAGLTPARMQTALTEVDWADMFLDNPEYGEMSQRNRGISRVYLPGTESGVGADGVRYQGGVVSGQKIKLFFNRLVGGARIEQLPLPLSIVATDIGNGEAVVFRDGALSSAMRASMSVPGLLAPVEYGGRKLVDGGLVDNLPVAEIRERCGADVIIAVNVGTPLLKAEQVGSLLTVSAQMIGILTQQNVARSLAQLGERDILIQPELDGISAGDFPRHVEAAARGRAAAQAVVERLAPLALAPAEYAAWWQGIEAQAPGPVRIDSIEVAGLRHVNPRALERFIDIRPGDTPSAGDIDRDLLRIYGDGGYESVDYSILGNEGRNILRIVPMEKPWGPDYLRFGIKLAADNVDGASFGLRAAYHKTWLNSLGGELLYHAELGSTNRLGVNYLQPLDPAQRYFSELLAGVSQERLSVFENDKRIAKYKITESRLGAWLGYNARVYGTLRLGWLQRRQDYRLDTGTLALPRGEMSFGGWQATLDFDRFDRMYFPTRGWSSHVSYFHAAGRGYSRLDADLRGAFSIADNIFNARFAYIGSPSGQLPANDAGRLGGFLNMTAYSAGQLLGDDIRYAGLRSERIIGRLPLGLRGDMRLGVAVEAARLGRRFSERARDGWLDSLAVYLGGETPLGRAYLGVAHSRQGVSNLFLFIGTP